jgi:hypothetical protein
MLTARHRVLWATVVLCASAPAVACTGAGAGAGRGTPTSSGTGSVAAVAPSATDSSSPAAPTPPAAALVAYERYIEASAQALAAGDATSPELAQTARGQALRRARRRVRANARDGVVVTGALTPSATAEDVVFDGAGTAKVTDCVRNDLEQVAADDPDDVVVEATGWRQPVEATVAERAGGWIVTKVKVPLRDGSGRVPPPPDDPPYLRGPAQGPAPPSCVPDALARDAVAAYEAFRDAYDTAIGIGRSGPAMPDLPALADTAVDPQLSTAREFISSLEAKGQAFRGEPSVRDPWAVSALDSDRSVFVYDCVIVGAHGITSEDKTEPETQGRQVASHRLDAADVVRSEGSWKVATVSVISEGLNECTSPDGRR